MFTVGDKVTIKPGGMYDDCGCEYCNVLSEGGYGIVQNIRERPDSDDGPVCGLQLFDRVGVQTNHTSVYTYRFIGLELLYTNKEPDWEV